MTRTFSFPVISNSFSCPKYPISIVCPMSTVPESGCNNPIIHLSNVDLPHPLGPMIPILSSLLNVYEKSLNNVLSPKALDIFSRIIVLLPILEGRELNRTLRSSSGRFLSLSSSNLLICAFCIVERALAPRLIHARSFLYNAAAFLSAAFS